MARFDNQHSRLVALAKVLLPLASLALLTTVFLFSRGKERELSIPYAQVEIEKLAREQRLENPTYATVLDDGAELTIKADIVRPNLSNKDVISSNSVLGELTLPDGSNVAMQAANVVLDGQTRIAELSGDVVVETSSGYTLNTNRIAALLDDSQIIGPDQIEAIGPAGIITAGAMEISKSSQANNYVLVFKEGVKMIYQPQ